MIPSIFLLGIFLNSNKMFKFELDKLNKMKKILTLILSAIFLISCTSYTFESRKPNSSIYDISIKQLNGEKLDLSKFKGKKLMVVNVASKCGYTRQYEDLQKLYEKYKGKLEIIGVPCNQFMGQEPGSPEEIQTFCKKNYGVTFQLTEKVDVKGPDQHALYQWLTKKELNGSEDSKVSWNFQKYLLDENGQLIAIFKPGTEPLSDEITSKIK